MSRDATFDVQGRELLTVLDEASRLASESSGGGSDAERDAIINRWLHHADLEPAHTLLVQGGLIASATHLTSLAASGVRNLLGVWDAATHLFDTWPPATDPSRNRGKPPDADAIGLSVNDLG